ncbi:tRNA (guanosine(46)-N7)-methyltransferase TrmB [Telmatospirillum sp. J64-1]|uniref:tRNA (guanosine(46)-N7)-methyltransferase TrmB n=1 Tax=Telmatospirillum sp. J64-1 TaxID=2502183 RepID=UPI00115CE576|nr:tRNA (guanosine(46)-N7)-methyltransferase TrmB [Telmatospirillum sp. J64-1]
MSQPEFEDGKGGVREDAPRFYGRRRGKRLRVQAQGRLEEMLPRLTLPEPGPDERLDPPSLFPSPVREVWLEVGFGGGEHLAEQAARHPDVGIIGCEVFVNGIASLMKHLEAKDPTPDNVRVFPEDARLLMPALPDGALTRVFVLFPDPWPKKRHAERRFINQDNLDQIARLLRVGGELRVASDDANYVDWTLEQLAKRPEFEWTAKALEECRIRPDDWPPTRYEGKAVAVGRPCAFMRFRRKA